ncbi:GIY-YIG nuclease family protein [Altererythrobacter sp.]|uniref:GIY-YIG nuclease family protein n=1 Tax=Altererythrobacter sp. TaxID=1872480 RepID=UPI003D100CBE
MADLLAQVEACLPGGVPVEPERSGECTDGKGAYALLIQLARTVRFERAALGVAMLSGWLVYAGSANGPGGLRARLARHFRKGKAIRWHVDELTTRAADIMALAIPGGSECAIVDALLASGRFEVAMPGIGSSDCKNCEAHLLRYNV